MQKFNIVLATPECFLEVAQLLRLGLEDLGLIVFTEGLQKDCWNIFLGYQFFFGKPLPEGYRCIVYQLEQRPNDHLRQRGFLRRVALYHVGQVSFPSTTRDVTDCDMVHRGLTLQRHA